jgi:hypothetical protein
MEVSDQIYAPEALTQGKAPDTHQIGGWSSLGAGLNTVEKRKVSCPCRELNHYYSVIQSIVWSLYRLSYPESPVNIVLTNNHYLH